MSQGHFGGGIGQPPGSGGWGPPPGSGFAPPPGFGPQAPLGPMAWSPTEALEFAWGRIKADPVPIVVYLFVAWLCASSVNVLGSVASQVYMKVAQPRPFDPLLVAIQVVTVIGNLLAQMFMLGGIFAFTLKVARGQPYTFGDIFSGGRYLASMTGTSILTTIGSFIGLLLLVVPGVYVLLAWSLAMFFVVDQNMGAVEAMKASWRATEGHRGNLLLFFVLAALLTVIGVCTCGLGFLVLIPLIQIAMAWTYLRITGQATA